MRKTDVVRLAELERDNHLIDTAAGLLSHPIYSTLALFVIVEALQQMPIKDVNGKPGRFFEKPGTTLEAIFGTTAAINGLAPAIGAAANFLPAGKALNALGGLLAAGK